MADIIEVDQDISLLSSTITANLYEGAAVTLWTAGSYSSGAQVYYAGAEPHLVYTSLVDSNTATPGTDPEKWAEGEATDRYAMFDPYTNTQSFFTYQIEVEVGAGKKNAVGLFSLQAKTVDLELSVDSEVIKSETIQMETIAAPTFYDYAFTDLVIKDDLFWTFPRYPTSMSPVLKVTITYVTGELAKVGMMKLGQKITIGETRENAKVGITDYSKESEDAFGRISLTKGDYAKKPDIDIWLKNKDIPSVYRKLAQLRGTHAIYNCNNSGTDHDCLLVYGKFDDFNIDISGGEMSRCSITLKGASRGDL